MVRRVKDWKFLFQNPVYYLNSSQFLLPKNGRESLKLVSKINGTQISAWKIPPENRPAFSDFPLLPDILYWNDTKRNCFGTGAIWCPVLNRRRHFSEKKETVESTNNKKATKFSFLVFAIGSSKLFFTTFFSKVRLISYAFAMPQYLFRTKENVSRPTIWTPRTGYMNSRTDVRHGYQHIMIFSWIDYILISSLTRAVLKITVLILFYAHLKLQTSHVLNLLKANDLRENYCSHVWFDVKKKPKKKTDWQTSITPWLIDSQ